MIAYGYCGSDNFQMILDFMSPKMSEVSLSVFF